MTQSEHHKKMSELEDKFLTRLSDKDEEISKLKFELSEFQGIMGALKLLLKKIDESKEFIP